MGTRGEGETRTWCWCILHYVIIVILKVREKIIANWVTRRGSTAWDHEKKRKEKKEGHLTIAEDTWGSMVHEFY